MKKSFLLLCTIMLCATATVAQTNRSLLATGNSAANLRPIPVAGLSAMEIERIITEINPYTLYRKGSTVEYCFEQGGRQTRLLGAIGGPTYFQFTVVEEAVENGLLVAYIKRDFFNKKYKPSKGLPKSFKEQLLKIEIDTTGTYFQTYDIARDIYHVIEKQGYAMAITKELKKGDDVICGTVVNKCKPTMGKNFHHTIKYSDFKVVSEEQITTPAGTFKCLKLSGFVDEDVDSKNAYVHFNYSKCNMWICKGIGVVKYEVYENGYSPWILYLNKADIK